MDKLRQQLHALDGRSYKAYKDLAGPYYFPDFELRFDHVQGDPFAAPSRLSLTIGAERAGLPVELWNSEIRRLALEDFLGRQIARAIHRHVRGNRGSGHSGAVGIAGNTQQVLVRNAVHVGAAGVEARITLALPADGRRILGTEAITMCLDELPKVVAAGLLAENLDAEAMRAHVESVEDQAFLRGALDGAGLVAFIADGARLPRASGIDDAPLTDGVVPFQTPAELAREFDLPNAGTVRGMGIPTGISLIVGGGFHGKSTLLKALEQAVHNHCPGDGRERVATRADAIKIRAEDGRAVNSVDISAFIGELPGGRSTDCFNSDNASGSTSQAAAISEALEIGCRLLLIDEDTSATNFMIRDERMQRLVADDKEPITPLVQRVRSLFETQGVSSIIVMGGSGDYLSVADRVIMMDNYRARDVSQQARQLAGEAPNAGVPPPRRWSRRRTPAPVHLSAARGRRDVKIDVQPEALLYGTRRVELGRLEQLLDKDQILTIGWLIHRYAGQYPGQPLSEALARLQEELEQQGLDILTPWKVGNLARPRMQDLAAVMNRMRKVDWRQG